MDIRSTLRAMRHPLSQAQMAERAGVDQPTISRIEGGDPLRGQRSPESVARIVATYGEVLRERLEGDDAAHWRISAWLVLQRGGMLVEADAAPGEELARLVGHAGDVTADAVCRALVERVGAALLGGGVS